MSTKIVKTLRFPDYGTTGDDYQINAQYLDGKDGTEFAYQNEGTFFIEGTGSTAGTWLGSSERITSYYEGLAIRYKVPIAGASTTTLNINGLGAKTIYRFGTSKLTTQFTVGSILHLVYYASLNGGCWCSSDYDSNSDTKVRQYNKSTNKEYSLLARYDTASVNTDAYDADYALFSNDVTLNPSSGTITATKFKGALGGSLTMGTKTYNGSADVEFTASDLGLEQAMKFLGSTTTAITDGSTTKTITVNSTSVTATNGNVVLYNGYEYVWTGSVWEQLGQEGSFSLKTHKHTVSYTPSGTVGTPTITVTPNTTTVNSITNVGSLPSLTYMPGQASRIDRWSDGDLPDLTTSPVTFSRVSSWYAGESPSASLDPGDVDTYLTASISNGPNRVVTLSLHHTYEAPVLTFDEGALPSLTYYSNTVDTVTDWYPGTLPSLDYTPVDVDNITNWSAGTLPTKSANTTVVTSIKSATSTQPTFTGTPATPTTSVADS